METPKRHVSPGELVKQVARALHLPEVKVDGYYRSLREAGLVTKGGRGTSAAAMTWDDWRVLILGCASSTASGAPDHVRSLQRARRVTGDGPDTLTEAFDSAFERATRAGAAARVELYVDQACAEIRSGRKSSIFANSTPAEARRIIDRGGSVLLITPATLAALLNAYFDPDGTE